MGDNNNACPIWTGGEEAGRRLDATLRKILITLCGDDVSSRFDLATEVLVASLAPDGSVVEQKTMVLSHASPEELCHMILAEGIRVVICGGIEEEYHQYLTWKKVEVLDSVMGAWTRALEQLRKGGLEAGAILHDRPGRREKG